MSTDKKSALSEEIQQQESAQLRVLFRELEQSILGVLQAIESSKHKEELYAEVGDHLSRAPTLLEEAMEVLATLQYSQLKDQMRTLRRQVPQPKRKMLDKKAAARRIAFAHRMAAANLPKGEEKPLSPPNSGDSKYFGFPQTGDGGTAPQDRKELEERSIYDISPGDPLSTQKEREVRDWSNLKPEPIRPKVPKEVRR